jgi:hypothetical protein
MELVIWSDHDIDLGLGNYVYFLSHYWIGNILYLSDILCVCSADRSMLISNFEQTLIFAEVKLTEVRGLALPSSWLLTLTSEMRGLPLCNARTFWVSPSSFLLDSESPVTFRERRFLCFGYQPLYSHPVSCGSLLPPTTWECSEVPLSHLTSHRVL